MTRWVDDYVLLSDATLRDFLRDRGAARRRTLYIVGDGFDPRAPTAPALLKESRGTDAVQFLRLGLRPSTLPNDERGAVESNRHSLDAVTDGNVEDVPYPDVADPKSAGGVVIRTLLEQKRLDDVDDVFVDVSALPVDVYFAIVGGLLRAAQQQLWSGELFVIACENPQLDDAIVGEGTEDVAYLPGFSVGPEALESAPKIWVPLLGRGRAEEARRVFDQLRPAEICPVLPAPSRDARRADDIVVEQRALLFDELAVDPRNFIYATEWNPFDLYRQVSVLDARYRDLLGDASLTLSTHASKLLSLGVLLAAHAHNLGVMHTTPTGYYLRSGTDVAELRTGDRVFCAWIDGTPYA